MQDRGTLVAGRVLLGLGVVIVGLGAWSAMPYWMGESSRAIELVGLRMSLVIGLPLMLAGAFAAWAAEGAAASSRAGTGRRRRPGGVVVDIAAFLACAVFALAVVVTLDPLMGVLSALACAPVLWAEQRRLRRGRGGG